MTVWRPWDADDDEYSELLVVREIVPDALRPALHTWLTQQMHTGYNATNAARVNWVQSALRTNFGYEPGGVLTEDFVIDIENRGDRFVMRVVDLWLAQFEREGSPFFSMPAVVADIAWHLDQNSSAVKVVLNDDQVYRLTARLPLGVEDVAQAAVSSADVTAGRHLSKAWVEAQSLDPNTSSVMTEAIRAVEAAAGGVVIPKDKRPQLSKIVGALRENPKWTLVLPARDDGYPDQRAVLIGMLETLAFAERQRHSGSDPSPLQAQAHVQLASTLVAWFSLGVVVKQES